MKVCVVSACDQKYFNIMSGLLNSLKTLSVDVAVVDLGLSDNQVDELRARNVNVQSFEYPYDFPARQQVETSFPGFKGYICRPYLNDCFPSYEVLIWLDADTWIQDSICLDELADEALRYGMAAVPEVDRGYFKFTTGFHAWDAETHTVIRCFGNDIASKMRHVPIINGGVVATRTDAPHWNLYRKYLQEGLSRISVIDDQSRIVEQTALNMAIQLHKLPVRRFPCTYNWLACLALPAWHVDRKAFVDPNPPYSEIKILHLSAHFLDNNVTIPLIGHQMSAVSGVQLTWNGANNLCNVNWNGVTSGQADQITQIKTPEANTNCHHKFSTNDYVSPGFQTVKPDTAFPNMIIGDTQACKWAHFRREVPHNWYVDKRFPHIGFISRDEAHILYNNALQFKGKRALEIGCWMGWSTCHLALSGVELDVIDPILAKSIFSTSVINSIQSACKTAGIMGKVNLVSGNSPEKVEELACKSNMRWSFIFIDGSHDGLGPLTDAIVCHKYAEKDSMILFHDLASPDVAQGLDYLKFKGWHTIIYQTMQIMGAAWRGNVKPVMHEPDPKIRWVLPEHLKSYEVSSISRKASLMEKDEEKENRQEINSGKSPFSIRNFNKEFKELLSMVRPYTIISESRLFSLYSLAKQVCKDDIPGNFVECGTYKGGSAAVMAYVIKKYSLCPRRLYAFDTFDGMPEPTDVDCHNGIPANLTGFGSGTLKAPIRENLEKICQLLDIEDIVIPVQGLFSQTLPKYRSEIESISLLHADGDWYESTMDIFNTLYDIVASSGFIQIDDYGHWEGCRKAIHEFTHRRGESFRLQSIDYTGVWFQKK